MISKRNDPRIINCSNTASLLEVLVFQAAIAQTREKLASTFGEVTWQGKTVPIRNEKVRVFILRHQDKDTELERQIKFEDKMQIFDNIMMECKDVLQIVKDELGSEMVSHLNLQMR